MANIMAGSLGGLFPNLSMERLEVLSVVLNNSCNLRCRHCYLEPESHEPFLNREEWCTFFTSLFRDVVPSVVSFAGKEIFTDQRSVGLFFEAIRTRDRLQRGAARRTHIGVITNGTLLHRFRERILGCPADHIDVSVDGLPPVHNEIRGPGAFDQLAPNLHWLTEAFPDRVWLTHTLFTQNICGLPEFVTFYERMFGQRRFSLGLYQPLPYTSTDLVLTDADRLALFDEALYGLGSIDVEAPVEVILELGVESTELVSRLRGTGWIGSDAAISSTAHIFGNGLMLRINVCAIAVGLWRSVRVTPEGYWLAAEDLIYAKEYQNRAAARLRDHCFDASRTYEAALEDAGFAKPLPRSVARPGDGLGRGATWHLAGL